MRGKDLIVLRCADYAPNTLLYNHFMFNLCLGRHACTDPLQKIPIFVVP